MLSKKTFIASAIVMGLLVVGWLTIHHRLLPFTATPESQNHEEMIVAPVSQNIDDRGPIDAADDRAPKKPRVLFGVMGLKNRDHGCAKISHYRVMEHIRSHGFDVESYAIVHTADEMVNKGGASVDGEHYDGLYDKCPYDGCELRQTELVKEDMNIHCQTRMCNTVFVHRPRQLINANLQLNSEWAMGEYLRQHEEKYDLTVVVSSDYYLMENIPIDQLRLVMHQNSSVLGPASNDFGGYSNGLLAGPPHLVGDILARMERKPGSRVWPTHKYNYESQVKAGYIEAGISRIPIRSMHNPKPFQDALYAKNVPVQKSCLYLHGREKACPPATNAVDATASTTSAPSIASTTSAPSIAASIMT